jgi:hypothetical protein
VSTENDSAASSVPSISTERKPMRLPSQPPIGPANSIMPALGSISRPASVTLIPNP